MCVCVCFGKGGWRMGVWLCVCMCGCVGVWVCGCVGGWVCVGGNKGAGAKKNESVSDLIGLRGWSWMLELFEAI